MKTVFIPECPCICEQCAENPAEVTEDFLIAYCAHHRFGGILSFVDGRWQVSGPYSDDEEFRRALGFALMQTLARKTANAVQ